MGCPLVQTKSPAVWSQSSVPLVTPMNSVSVLLLASQYSTSLPTHGEAAASGDDSSKRYRDWDSACSIEGQSCGVAEREVSSRKTRKARRLYQGLPSLWITDCSAAATGLSLAWL